jgi:hypothetical protein
MARRARGGDSADEAHAALSGLSASGLVIYAKDLGWSSASALIAAASGHRGLG